MTIGCTVIPFSISVKRSGPEEKNRQDRDVGIQARLYLNAAQHETQSETLSIPDTTRVGRMISIVD